MDEQQPGRPWHVFVTYLGAVAVMIMMAIPVTGLLQEMYPDVPSAALFRTLPGLLVGTLASSGSLLLTLLLAVRPLDAARFRLRPGWETGTTLTAMALGLLALGQSLESATVLLGIEERGTLVMIRQILEQTRGADLFAAVLVLGFVAGAAEEIFFRGYMQWRLREHWSPRPAVLATSVSFALLHADPSGVHMVQALALGLYLGFVAEASGSTLPSIVCHVVNNVVYTLQTALGVAVVGRDANAIAAVLGAVLFAACVLWVRRAAPGPMPA